MSFAIPLVSEPSGPDISLKSQGQPFICGVLMATKAVPFAVKGEGAFQSFMDSGFVSENFEPLYNSVGKVKFLERGKNTKSGLLYSQTLTLSFPNGDAVKASRLDKITKAKFFAIALTTGKHLVIGRNDVKQNTAPKIATTSTEATTQLKITTTTIFPTGFLYLEGSVAFPFLIPAIP